MLFKQENLNEKEILALIDEYELSKTSNLMNFIEQKRHDIPLVSLSSIVELANTKRHSNNAFFTNQFIVDEIVKDLPKFKKDEITIIEPSVGSGNFLSALFHYYQDIKKVNLIVIDIDQDMLETLKILYQDKIPNNFCISFICQNFMDFDYSSPVDLIIGNPPFTKLTSTQVAVYLPKNYNNKTKNLAAFFLEKAIKMADYVSFIMPKNLLNTPEYALTRHFLKQFSITKILDIGEKGFKGVLVETINIVVSKLDKISIVEIHSLTEEKKMLQPKSYIFDEKLPYWVIYRDKFFDDVAKTMVFDIFEVFRDRQITNSNSSLTKNQGDIRVVKSRNINDTGTNLIEIKKYDAFITQEQLKTMAVAKFLENENVYMTPNMTYRPRLMKKSKGYVVNGSIAILIPKTDIKLSNKQMIYIASDEFRKFYRIARNYQTRSLNVDKCSVYWFGAYKG